MDKTLKYILITPSRNEEKYIEKTIKSVIEQTFLPEKWIIVSDGSTDRTDEIVKHYESKADFIQLLRREPGTGRDFGSKVYAIMEGVRKIPETTDYSFIGVMDSDVSFEPSFFEDVLSKMESNKKIGIGSAVVYEQTSGKWIPKSYNYEWSASGSMQMFSRQCFEATGGYIPLKRGGVDMIAEVMARMNGWQATTFPDMKIYHHRRMGAEKGSTLYANFRRGMMEYVNGYHPLFQTARFFSWIPLPPFLLAAVFRTSGYLWSMMRREPFAVPLDVAMYLRKEQMMRLKQAVLKK